MHAEAGCVVLIDSPENIADTVKGGLSSACRFWTQQGRDNTQHMSRRNPLQVKIMYNRTPSNDSPHLKNRWYNRIAPLKKRQRAFGTANELSAWLADRRWSKTRTPFPAD